MNAKVRTTTVAVLACAALATACSHSTPTPAAANVGSAALAYSNCMRSHGIADFPDPNSSGQIDLKEAALQGGASSDLNNTNPQFSAAATACQSLQPTESSGQQHQDAAKALDWARCMRSHGITNFPDPDSSGGFHVAAIRADGVDVTTPQFQAAATACEQYQPGDISVPGGSGGP
jgi:hypothetical protein